VGGFLVMGCGFVSAIDLSQQEPGWVVGLLDHIEARDARFFHAVLRVLDAGCFEGLDGFRFDSNMNVNDEHGSSSECGVQPPFLQCIRAA